mmetsp:Transcript_46230/g.91174  ORF Transcript_46230/g.91174 Transcript_46230/m.91174 type:complete len:201 (-) Transcript_46230:169-771(-)
MNGGKKEIGERKDTFTHARTRQSRKWTHRLREHCPTLHFDRQASVYMHKKQPNRQKQTNSCTRMDVQAGRTILHSVRSGQSIQRGMNAAFTNSSIHCVHRHPRRKSRTHMQLSIHPSIHAYIHASIHPSIHLPPSPQSINQSINHTAESDGRAEQQQAHVIFRSFSCYLMWPFCSLDRSCIDTLEGQQRKRDGGEAKERL